MKYACFEKHMYHLPKCAYSVAHQYYLFQKVVLGQGSNGKSEGRGVQGLLLLRYLTSIPKRDDLELLAIQLPIIPSLSVCMREIHAFEKKELDFDRIPQDIYSPKNYRYFWFPL